MDSITASPATYFVSESSLFHITAPLVQWNGNAIPLPPYSSSTSSIVFGACTNVHIGSSSQFYTTMIWDNATSTNCSPPIMNVSSINGLPSRLITKVPLMISVNIPILLVGQSCLSIIQFSHFFVVLR
jgi:hypothetical protein